MCSSCVLNEVSMVIWAVRGCFCLLGYTCSVCLLMMGHGVGGALERVKIIILLEGLKNRVLGRFQAEGAV